MLTAYNKSIKIKTNQPNKNLKLSLSSIMLALLTCIQSPTFAQSSSTVSIKARFNASIQSAYPNATSVTNAYYFGVNNCGITPSIQTNAAFQNSEFGMGMRLRRWNPSDLSAFGWADSAGNLNAAAIQAAFASIPSGTKIIFSTGKFPSAWCTQDPNGVMLDPDKYGAYANYCAQLVNIIQPVHPIDYWEVFNEPPTGTDPVQGALALANIYNQCALAMKAVNPSITIGTNAINVLNWPSSSNSALNAFVSNTASNLGFITFHCYPDGASPAVTGPTTACSPTSNQQLYAIARIQAAGMGAYPGMQWRSVLNSLLPNRNIPIFMDEYNLNPAVASNGATDSRIQSSVGAVCDAIQATAAIRGGLSGICAHCDLPNGNTPTNFGHMDNNFNFYNNGTLQQLLNCFFVGNINLATSSDETQVLALAATNSNYRSLMLMNENSSNTSVTLSLGMGASNKQVTVYKIDGSGYSITTTDTKTLSSGVTLTPDSVTVYRITN